MGGLERWDEHNQQVMDRARARGVVTEWTIGSVLYVAFCLLWIAGDLPRWLAVVVQATVLVIAAVGIGRVVRRRRSEHATGVDPSASRPR